MRTRSALLALLALVAIGCAVPSAEEGIDEIPDDEPTATEEAIEEATPPEPSPPEPSPPEPAPPALTAPVRAVWVHLFDDTLKTPEGIATLVEELAEAEATAVIAQVARRHDAYYASEVLPATTDPDLAEGLDVLAELVPLAHAAGIEVHAWVSLAPTWHRVYEELPVPDGWLPAEHGRDAPVEDRWVTRTVDGEWSEYLDPALPEVRAHLAEIAVELAATTAVDGIHLDYVRYESPRHGYHPAALAAYQEAAGTDAVPAPDDPAFVAWRQAQTRGVVAHVTRALEEVPRSVALSAAVITWGPGPAGTEEGSFAATRPATDALQDWPSWARDGLVDALFPMNYFRAHEPDQAAWFEQWLDLEAELATATDTLIVPGIAGWLNAPEAGLVQVGRATELTDGAALYSYQQPTDDGSRELWRQLAEAAWLPP